MGGSHPKRFERFTASTALSGSTFCKPPALPEVADSIPSLWQQREQLRPLLNQYGARVLGKAIAQLSELDHSRTSCHQLAALMMALTDFQEWFDYADFYISLGEQDPAVDRCREELRALHLFSREDAD